MIFQFMETISIMIFYVRLSKNPQCKRVFRDSNIQLQTLKFVASSRMVHPIYNANKANKIIVFRKKSFANSRIGILIFLIASSSCRYSLMGCQPFPIKQIDPSWIHPVLKQNVNFLIKKLDFKSRIEITRLSKNVNIKSTPLEAKIFRKLSIKVHFYEQIS